MNIFTITANGKSKKDVKLPSGRYDVNIEQWSKAQEHLNTALKANDLLEEGKLEESQKLAVESMCGTMSALSIGLEMDDLMRMDMDKVNNLFMMQFAWLQNETPKRKFKIKGKKFEIPNFGERSCGDFVDFFLLSSTSSHKINMQPHLQLKAEMEKLTSTLNAWASTLYLQTLQNQTYFRTP